MATAISIDDLRAMFPAGESTCVFRGQTRTYDSPLLPSFYRDVSFAPVPFEIPRECEIRGHNSHYFIGTGLSDYKLKRRMEMAEKYGLSDPTAWLVAKQRYYSLLLNYLGWPLTMSLIQQAGMESQGIDITSNIDVALFFALHTYRAGSYTPIDMRGDFRPTVYAWRVEDAESTSVDLQTSFIDMGHFFDLKTAWQALRPAKDLDELLYSLQRYIAEVLFNMEDFVERTRERPYDLLRRPPTHLKDRIELQDAWFLLPDMCFTSLMLRTFGHLIKREKLAYIDTESAVIGDATMMKECEEFEIVGYTPEDISRKCRRDIFPGRDATTTIMKFAFAIMKEIYSKTVLLPSGHDPWDPATTRTYVQKVDPADFVEY